MRPHERVLYPIRKYPPCTTGLLISSTRRQAPNHIGQEILVSNCVFVYPKLSITCWRHRSRDGEFDLFDHISRSLIGYSPSIRYPRNRDKEPKNRPCELKIDSGQSALLMSIYIFPCYHVYFPVYTLKDTHTCMYTIYNYAVYNYC